MGTAWILFQQLLQMLVYIAIGFVLFRTKLVTKEGSKALTHVLLYVILPCVIVNSYRMERTAKSIRTVGWSLLLGLLVLVVAMVVSALIFRRRRPIDNFSSSFSNAGFMGIPLITAVMGSGAVSYIAGMVALLNVLQWTYGQWIMGGARKGQSVRALLLNPVVLSLPIALLLYLTQLPLPGIVSGSISAISACNAPVAMIILGVFLGQSKLATIFTDWRAWVCSMVRLVVVPAVTLLVLWPMPEACHEIRMALFLAACAPVGSNVAVYAEKQSLDAVYASRSVCLSTLLSVVTMPLMLAAAQWVW